jgi:thiol-disulfide isomerase/thioredoxin
MSLSKSVFLGAFSVAMAFLLASCVGTGSKEHVRVTLEVRNQFQDEAWLEIKPIHYKYAPKTRWMLDKGDKVNLSIETPIPDHAWLVLRIGPDEYELPRIYDGRIHIEADGGQIPAVTNLQVNGEPLRDYLRWIVDDFQKQDSLRLLLPDFAAGNTDQRMRVARNRVKLARSVFEDTYLEHIHQRIFGDYLVMRLNAIARRHKDPSLDAGAERRKIVKEARRHNFFTLPVLQAQRAGSRDFTNAYANSFGIEDAVREQVGVDITIYDVQKVGYELFNVMRQAMADSINDLDAKAYTEMHLVAERLGDAPFDKAEPTFHKWMSDWGAKHPIWSDFLRQHYDGVKRVTPGQPGIPFRIEDNNGFVRTMDEFKGKYVLLDFWANWCAPCLEEFPDMRRIYEKYNRDDFEILGISLDLDRDYWLSRIPAHENPWPQLWAGKQFEQETFLAYRGGGIPFYILLDRDGKIVRYNDVRATFNLESVVDSLLAGE